MPLLTAHRRRIAASAILAVLSGLALAASPLAPAPPAGAACSSGSRTIGGAFTGEDGATISGFVGISLFDANGTSIGLDGCALPVGAYVADDRVNATANGCCFTRDVNGGGSGNERSWSIGGIPNNAAYAFIEAYPKSSSGDPSGLYNGFTDYRRYGGQMIPIGGINLNNNLTLPLNCSAGGNNGAINAVATINGAPADVYYVVAFSKGASGIQGFVASNEGRSGGFTVPALEPGQSYSLEINLRNGQRFWFENDYGYGVPVNACATTQRTFALDPGTGRAVSVSGLASAPSGASMAGQRNVFFRGGDGALWQIPDVPGATASSLGGGLTGEPDATSWGAGRTDVVVRGNDGQVWWRYYDNRTGGWGPWLALGGGTGYSPAITSWAPGRLDVVLTGLDGQLWHRYTANGGATWSGWVPLGGSLTSAPDVTTWGFDRLDIVARGREGAVWHRVWSSGWQPWEYLGGQLADGPSANSAGGNRLDVVVRGAGNRVYMMRWNGSGYTGWEWVGGGITDGEPDVTSYNGFSTIYVRGGDGAIWRTSRSGADGSFGGWSSLPI
jgi:hypothetical protein